MLRLVCLLWKIARMCNTVLLFVIFSVLVSMSGTLKAHLQLSTSKGEVFGKLAIDLYDAVYPFTVKAFVGMMQSHLLPEEAKAAHEAQIGAKLPPPLHGSKIQRVVPNEAIEFGTSATSSFFGGFFPDETPEGNGIPTHSYGTLSMSNIGKDTNASKYFISLVAAGSPAAKAMDGHHTVFGKITDKSSLETLQFLSGVKVNKQQVPIEPLVITACAIEQKQTPAQRLAALKAKKEAREARFADRSARRRRTGRDEVEEEDAQEEAEQGADGGEEEEYGARPAKRRRMEKVVVGLTSGKKTSHPSMQETGNNPAGGFDLMKAQKEVWMDNLEEIKEAQGARKKKKQAKAMRHMAKRKF